MHYVLFIWIYTVFHLDLYCFLKRATVDSDTLRQYISDESQPRQNQHYLHFTQSAVVRKTAVLRTTFLKISPTE